ncbi:uncharacterized protein BDV17DRAFT_295821 [Aspergillus undulatus]|uniref:uncharacterized protein n=1 Tax=Aspergillus undulatus TaxID=1810928 RepID=UPI003CCCC113
MAKDNCDAKAECGEYAEDPDVCCSKWGFCGTGEDFCGDGCQGDNCGNPTEPSCSSTNALNRVIGYYESWSSGRTCDSWRAADIAASGLTHINYAFALFHPTADDGSEWDIDFMADSTNDVNALIDEFITLKETNPQLSCFMSIGGWSFSDPGDSATYWSDMASTAAGRKSFAKAVLQTMQKYGFDGVDLDWEYPVDSDRGGSKEDIDNYVSLIIELRAVFDGSGEAYGITFTIPSSYWYLQNFNVPAMLEAGADWTNLMSYDLHGVWDGDNPYIGKVVGAHTNLTEIKQSLDLLWRAGVDPSKVVMGVGFYGRSFTLSDLSCTQPGCPFESGGNEGTCTATSGILSYKEIIEIMDDKGAELIWDEEAAVNWLTWDGYQWVSFDNEKTFRQKVDYANEVCLGGVMIWALDQDTYDWQALSGLIGQDVDSNNLLSGGSLSKTEKKSLARDLSAYTGTDCYVTECMDWNTGQCKTGYSVLDYVHSASLGILENPDHERCKSGSEGDEDAQYRLICCPTGAMPEGCSWEGGSEFGLCSGGDSFCGDNKYELVTDSYNDRTGSVPCLMNKRSLCCNTNTELEQCHWTSCGGVCPDDWAMNDWGTVYEGTNLNQDKELCTGGGSAFCCPSDDTYKNCDWYFCDQECPSDKVLITQRTEIDSWVQLHNFSTCLTGYNKWCCDPPSGSDVWPVDPEDIFEYPDEDNIMYYYKVEENANSQATDNDSKDPFAFVMITGDPEAYDESLVDQWSFLTDEAELTKRELKTHERRNMFEHRDDTYENEVEVYHIRCSSLSFQNSSACTSIFRGGASNTIVKMPKDIGAGPFARVISLLAIDRSNAKRELLPRSAADTYELTVDYDLAGASEEQKGDVNFRVDYTNLLAYWKDVTDTPADKRRKRWFGSYSAWLERMTTIVKEEQGALPLEYDKTMKLFHAEGSCPALNITATVDLDANIHLALNAQYGYYFEGAILPTPSLIAAYTYFSVKPEAAILLTLRGEAVWQSSTETVSIVSGIAFPGLSIKGLISVGPELELTGRLDASLSISGELNAGVVVSWPRSEVYFPQNEDGADNSVKPRGINGDEPQTYSFEPVFDASLTAEGNMALTLTPEVKFGMSVLGGSLMSGYVTAGVDNTISLGVSATASASGDGSAGIGFCYWADYVYSVFIRADVSFLDDLEYWGGEYEVASPDDPLVLVDQTCTEYTTDNPLAKRDDKESLVPNGSDSACFGGLVKCSVTASAGNSSCTLTDDDSSDESGDSEKVAEKRAPTCYNLPALFYNCDLFGTADVQNRNENTMNMQPTVSFIGICQNIYNYLYRNPGLIKGNGMELTYYPSSEQPKSNRKSACKDMTRECAESKANMWPTAVQSMYYWDSSTVIAPGQTVTVPAPMDYATMKGYDESLSCDEFPFNASEEGGTGAEVACVSAGQQSAQGLVNALLTRLYDERTGVGMQWQENNRRTWNGFPRKYRINLMSLSNDGTNLGYAGELTGSDTDLVHLLGGLNDWGNPELYLPASNLNAVCLIGARFNVLTNTNVLRGYGCKVTFAPQSVLYKRGLDPTNANDWIIEDVTIPEESLKHPIPLTTEDGNGYLDHAANDLEAMLAELELKESQEREPTITAAPQPRHLHRHRHHHGH